MTDHEAGRREAAPPRTPFPSWPYSEEAASYALTVNGRSHAVEDGWVGENLLFVLRDRLGLPGTKSACEQGECGACLVEMDGQIACSCCVLAVDAQDADIVTIEGMAEAGTADIERAMVDAGGVQCGFCTPGFVIAIRDLLQNDPMPSRDDIREALSGNLCRCTGYGRILDAVATLVAQRASAKEGGSR